MEKTIIEIIYNTAQAEPERLCVVDNCGAHSYAQIWHAACCAALSLRHYDIHNHDRVMVECTQNADYLICNFACNLVGAYFVPIEHKAASSAVAYIQQETEAVLLISEEMYDLPIPILSFRTVIDTTRDIQSVTWTFPDAEDTAEILYTTGTTGKSKGIEISHRNNVALAQNISGGTEMARGNVELIPLPLSHSHGLRCAYANFFMQGTIVLTEGVMKILDIYRLIKAYYVTALDLSPTAASVLLKLTRGKFREFDGQLDYIQIGTAALPEELKTALCEQFPNVRLYNFYGSTESGRSCALNFNSPDDRKYCIGYPTINAQFLVTDSCRNPISSNKDNTGLLACKGAMNMKGYWKQPELTAQIMRDGYVYTNDEGYIDERGFVYVLGRADDIINYKGIKIAPEEIEEIVLRYSQIKDCACIPVADKVAGQVPKIFYVVRNQASFDRADFSRFLEQHIDNNKLPRYMECIDEIPRSSNGKIQRKKLMAR